MKSSFVITSTFPERASVLYHAFLDSEIHSAFTGSEARVDDRVGGEFSAWDGYITGKTVALEENRKIVQNWRTTDFAEADEDSTLEIEFVENEKGTTLILKHSNLPEGTEDDYKDGWEDYYFAPLKTFLEDQSRG